jgi:hypothetical protein
VETTRPLVNATRRVEDLQSLQNLAGDVISTNIPYTDPKETSCAFFDPRKHQNIFQLLLWSAGFGLGCFLVGLVVEPFKIVSRKNQVPESPNAITVLQSNLAKNYLGKSFRCRA